MNDKDQSKLYYTISEVAHMFGITNAQLRHWEREFKQIHPQKTRNLERKYTAQDIEAIREIFILLKEKGYTISGARKALTAKKMSTHSEITSNIKEQLREKLETIHENLIALKAEIQKN